MLGRNPCLACVAVFALCYDMEGQGVHAVVLDEVDWRSVACEWRCSRGSGESILSDRIYCLKKAQNSVERLVLDTALCE